MRPDNSLSHRLLKETRHQRIVALENKRKLFRLETAVKRLTEISKYKGIKQIPSLKLLLLLG
jgi:hypothetical protein